jgi:hypothetical protein
MMLTDDEIDALVPEGWNSRSALKELARRIETAMLAKQVGADCHRWLSRFILDHGRDPHPSEVWAAARGIGVRSTETEGLDINGLTEAETSATASEQPERIGDLLAVLLRTSERIGASKDHAEVLKLRQERREAYHKIAKACGVVIFDGPDAFAEADAAQRRLDDEIVAAGGLEAWRATASVAGLMDEEAATEDPISALAQCRVRQCVAGLSAAAPWSKPMSVQETWAAAPAVEGEREAFEKWRTEQYAPRPLTILRAMDPAVAAWEAWRARSALTTHREHPAAQQERQEARECRNCAHWQPADEYETGHSLGVGRCGAAPMLWDSTEWSDEGDARSFTAEAVDKTAFVQDGSDYIARLYTKPQHGCTMWIAAQAQKEKP